MKKILVIGVMTTACLFCLPWLEWGEVLAQTSELVSVDSDGMQGNLSSLYPCVSSSGRFVAFHSYATNLVDDDTNGEGDVFVRDRQTGTTTRVSVDSDGNQGNISSLFPSISSDGRFVAFESEATNLVVDDTNGESDIFVHDRDADKGTDQDEVPEEDEDHEDNDDDDACCFITAAAHGFLWHLF